MPVAIHRTALADNGSIAARSNVGQRNGSGSNAASLYPQHAPVKVRPPIGSAHQVLVGGAPVATLRTLGPLAPIPVFHYTVGGIFRARFLLHLATVGVDEAVRAADGLRRGGSRRTRPRAVCGDGFALSAGGVCRWLCDYGGCFCGGEEKGIGKLG